MRTKLGARAAGAAVGVSCAAALVGALGAGGCKQVIGWEAATLVDGGFGGSGSASSSSSGSSTSSSSGTATVCEAGTTRPCYTGDAGTADAGACHGGTQACAADGMSWETSCEGEVTPQPKTCATTMDVACDGLPCVVWANAYGDATSGQEIDAVALDPSDGSLVVMGTYQGTIQFGSTTLMPSQGTRFVARIAADGTPVWAVPLTVDTVDAIAVDQGGNVYAAGYVIVSGTVGTLALTRGIYLLKLNSSGAPQWAQTIGDDVAVGTGMIPKGYVEGTSLAVAPDGDLVMAARFHAPINFTDGSLQTATGSAFVAKVSSADGTGSKATYGKYWAQALDGVDNQSRMLVGVDGTGNVKLGFTFAGTAHVGSYPMTATGTAAIGLVTFAPMGQVGLTTIDNSTGSVTLDALAVSPFGNVVIAGQTLGTLSFMDTSATVVPKSSMGDGFVARHDMAMAYVWSTGFGTNSRAFGVGLDMNGDARVAGWFTGTLDLGVDKLQGGTNREMLLAKLSGTDGSAKWNQGWPMASASTLLAVAPAGDSFVGGTLYAGPVDFGTGMLFQSSDASQAWAGRFAP